MFPESGRIYLFEAVLTTASPVIPGARRGSILSLQGGVTTENTIWRHMDFWDDLFFGKQSTYNYYPLILIRSVIFRMKIL